MTAFNGIRRAPPQDTPERYRGNSWQRYQAARATMSRPSSLPPPHSAISILFLGVFVPLADATFTAPTGMIWGLVLVVLAAQLIWPPAPVLASLIGGLFYGLARMALG